MGGTELSGRKFTQVFMLTIPWLPYFYKRGSVNAVSNVSPSGRVIGRTELNNQLSSLILLLLVSILKKVP